MSQQKKGLEVPKDRLASVDAAGSRVFIHPAAVKGFFSRWRKVVHWVLLILFLALPWIQIGGHQAILLDIPNRNFVFFGLRLFSHDAPILFFLFAALTLGLAFVTAIWGRVWCGWGCPQTVFVDSFFRKIEEWVEGGYLERRKLDAQDMDLRKLRLKTMKWSLFLLFSFLISHSFAAYFVGREEILQMVQASPAENPGVFAFVMFMTAIVAFDFGWFREQFCIIVCPYGRIQSALMDIRSLAVLYDYKRGEPRKAPEVPAEQQGDCVSCFRCVNVCPTGIDIRRGIQMECIACTACIDACDEIMEKVGKPKGLIRYASEKEIESGERISRFGKRGFIYGAATVVMLLGLTWVLIQRKPFYAAVIRSIEAPYENLAEDLVLNRFRIHLKNHRPEAAEVRVAVNVEGVEVIMAANPLKLSGEQDFHQPLLLRFPSTVLAGQRQRPIEVQLTYKTESGLEHLVVKPIALLGSATASP